MDEGHKSDSLPSKKRYYWGLLAGWIFMAIWAAAFFTLVRAWSDLSVYSNIGFSVALTAFVPSFGDIVSLFRSYNAHIQWINESEIDPLIGEEVEVLEAFQRKNDLLIGAVSLNVGWWQAQLGYDSLDAPRKGEILVVTKKEGNLLTVRRRNDV